MDFIKLQSTAKLVHTGRHSSQKWRSVATEVVSWRCSIYRRPIGACLHMTVHCRKPGQTVELRASKCGLHHEPKMAVHRRHPIGCRRHNQKMVVLGQVRMSSTLQTSIN
ncbi:unnamed protein product [Ixodes persulcatus]